MLVSSLADPADPRWRNEPGHNSVVERALTEAYAYLARAKTFPGAYLRAHAAVARCADLPMSAHQHMLVRFALGAAYAGGDTFASALDCFDAALDQAEDIDDHFAQIELAHLAGATARAHSGYVRATDYYSYGLDVLWSLGTDNTSADTELALEMLLGLGICDYTLERYESAATRLASARAVANLASGQPHRAAIDWAEAILRRWRGDPEQALSRALAALEAYSHAASSASTIAVGRLQTVVADIALDIAYQYAKQSPSHARAAYVGLAEPFALRAVELARQSSDLNGEHTALLARARLERAAARRHPTAATIESVITWADEKEDALLLAQAYTALGHDYMTRDSQESTEHALNCYRKALDATRATEAPFIGYWARRALLGAIPHQ